MKAVKMHGEAINDEALTKITGGTTSGDPRNFAFWDELYVCVNCGAKFSNQEDAMAHMSKKGHAVRKER